MTQPLAPRVDLPKEQRAVVSQSVLAFAVCAPALVLASLGLPGSSPLRKPWRSASPSR